LEEFLDHKAIFQSSSSLKKLDLFEQLTRVLRNIAEHHPLLLILDDFQWADDASISFLFHLARRIEDRPILLVCSYRPGEVAQGRDGDRHPLDQVINEIKRIYGDVTLDLSEGDSEDEMTFINAFLDSEANKLTGEFRQALLDHTGGHPLFTIELLRAMQERGDLIKDTNGDWIEGEQLDWNQLPARVEAVIEERFARLEGEIRDLLSVASVEGKDFTAQVLARIQKMEERELLSELSRELSKRHRLVRELGEIVLGQQILSKFQFAHHLFQSYLYNGISAAERRLLHGEITNVLEDIFFGEEERMAIQLAYHSQRANLTDKALRYLRIAGDQSKESYANEDAIRYYSDLLELIPDPTRERFDVLGLRSSVFGILGQRPEQIADAEEMLGIARKVKDGLLEIDAQLALWDAYIEGEHLLSKKPAEEALKLAKTIGNPVKEAGAIARLGVSAWFTNDYITSVDYLTSAITLFREEGMLLETTRCLTELSLTYGSLNEFPKAMECALEAIELSREIGDRRIEAISLRRLAIVHTHLEQHEEAMPIAEQALALHREVGDIDHEAAALNVLGIIYLWLGRLEQAETAFKQSLQLGHDLFSTTAIHFATWNLATSFYWTQGQYEDSVALVEREIEWAVSNEDEWLIGALNYTKGILEAEIGLHKEALQTWTAAHAVIERNIPLGPWHAGVLSNLSLMHTRLGDYEKAADFIDQSMDFVLDLPTPANRVWAIIPNVKLALFSNDQQRLRSAKELLFAQLDPIMNSCEYVEKTEALNMTAQIYLIEEDPEGAIEYSLELAQLLDYLPGFAAKQDYAYTHAQVLHALGKHEEAKPFLKIAYDWISFVADNMKNKTWRKAWLEDARQNKEILELAAEWGIS
jgi:predicted ATPase